MSQSDLVRAFDSYYYEEARTARHHGATGAPVDGAVHGEAHPLRYDGRGLPIREDLTSSLERMRRRLTGHAPSRVGRPSGSRHSAPGIVQGEART